MLGTTPYVKGKVKTGINCPHEPPLFSVYSMCLRCILYSKFVSFTRAFSIIRHSHWRVRLFSHPVFILLLIFVALFEVATWWENEITFSKEHNWRFANVYYPHWFGKNSFAGSFTIRVRNRYNDVMVMGDYYTVWQQTSREYRIIVLRKTGLPVHCIWLALACRSLCFGCMYSLRHINYHLSIAKLISKNTIRLQHQLFVTLCLQASLSKNTTRREFSDNNPTDVPVFSVWNNDCPSHFSSESPMDGPSHSFSHLFLPSLRRYCSHLLNDRLSARSF